MPLAARLSTLVRVAALALAAQAIVAFVAIALLRIGFPFELEWMEGGAVDHVGRVLAGEPLYVEPSLDFTPFIYTPAYWWVAAAVAKVTGLGFFPLRLVSVVATIGSFALLFVVVRRETGHAGLGVLAAGLYAATFRASGGWFDLARVDSLFVALLLAAVYAIRFVPALPGAALATALLSLAYLTKQSALGIAAPLVLWAIWDDRRRGLALAVGTGALVGGSTLLLDALHGGWFRYYVFALPSAHAWVPEMVVGFWRDDLAARVGIGLALAGLLVVRARGPARGFHLAFLGGALVSSWLSRLHFGGWDNVLMPAHAAIALAAPAALARLRGLPLAAGHAAVAAQLALLWYPPSAQLPTDADRRAGERLVERIRALPGELWFPAHGYLAQRAGRPVQAHACALWDVLRGPAAPARLKLEREIEHAVSGDGFEAIILDGDGPVSAANVQVSSSFERVPLFASDDPAFYPVSGYRCRPDVAFVGRAETSAADGPARPP